MSATLTPEILEQYRERRVQGTSVKALALELGITWQKLDKAIRNGTPKPADSDPTTCRSVASQARRTGPLAEKYRPRTLDALFGQTAVVKFLRNYAGDPYPVAMLFSGETGTGKTSAAQALAVELGCGADEFGGLYVVASGEQTADAVRECCDRMWLRPMQGSGWKVFIINECDRMHVKAETIWLDRLENIPGHTAVVFTTNHSSELSQRFRDRCMHLTFESDAAKLRNAVREFLKQVWTVETGRTPDPKLLGRVITESIVDGQLSFRRAVQLLQPQMSEHRRAK